MPNIARLYIIVHNDNLAAAETAAEEVDAAGVGVGSFKNGAPLSADGTHTHSAANVLRGCIDPQEATDFYSTVPFDAVYGCTDKLGEGEIYRFDGTEYTGPIGTGDLETLALQDAGLDTYQTETLV